MTGRRSSATDKALRLVAQGMTGYKAAKKCGLALSTVYRAIKSSQDTIPPPEDVAPRFEPENAVDEAL